MTTDTAVLTPVTEPLAQPWISHGCEFPTDQQANLDDPRGNWAAGLRRRHPWIGNRPHWSGYCVIPECECECHQAQPETIREVTLDVFDA